MNYSTFLKNYKVKVYTPKNKGDMPRYIVGRYNNTYGTIVVQKSTVTDKWHIYLYPYEKPLDVLMYLKSNGTLEYLPSDEVTHYTTSEKDWTNEVMSILSKFERTRRSMSSPIPMDRVKNSITNWNVVFDEDRVFIKYQDESGESKALPIRQITMSPIGEISVMSKGNELYKLKATTDATEIVNILFATEVLKSTQSDRSKTLAA